MVRISIDELIAAGCLFHGVPLRPGIIDQHDFVKDGVCYVVQVIPSISDSLINGVPTDKDKELFFVLRQKCTKNKEVPVEEIRAALVDKNIDIKESLSRLSCNVVIECPSFKGAHRLLGTSVSTKSINGELHSVEIDLAPDYFGY